MKRFLYCIFLFLISAYSFSQTQLEMNQTEHKKFLKADKELNQAYQDVLKEYKSDSIFIKALKTSQTLWIRFRDAEMEMMYPNREPGYYGSIHPMCWSIYKTELTTERTRKLRMWLVDQEEGDSCSPSIKVKP